MNKLTAQEARNILDLVEEGFTLAGFVRLAERSLGRTLTVTELNFLADRFRQVASELDRAAEQIASTENTRSRSLS